MKKITTLFVALAVTATGFSQFAMPDVKLHRPINTIKKNVTNNKANATWQIDYDAFEMDLNDPTPGYERFIWSVNTQVSDSASLNNMVVMFDSIYDHSTFTTYTPVTDYTSITIDSLWIAGGHNNYSGTQNDIIISVIPVASGYPNVAGTPYWTNTVSTSTALSAGNNWLSSTVIAQQPNYTMPVVTDKFAVMVEYQGAINDTFGILAGYTSGGACAQIPTITSKAVPTLFPFNTVAQWTQYSTSGTLPTAGGGDVYYDCDGSGTFNAGDGSNFVQNGAIWVQVTINDAVGIDEVGNEVAYKVYPNPSNNGIFTVELNSNESENVNMVVRDVLGKTIINRNVAISGKTKETVSLSDYSKGVYFLTVGNKTRKLIVE